MQISIIEVPVDEFTATMESCGGETCGSCLNCSCETCGETSVPESDAPLQPVRAVDELPNAF